MDIYQRTDLARELGRALPTLRHAEVLLSSVTSLLDEQGWVDEYEIWRRLFRRDPAAVDLLVPWPLVTTWVSRQALEAEELPAPVLEPESAGKRPKQLAELAIGCGAQFALGYDLDGKKFESSLRAGRSADERDALLELLVSAVREARGVEGLAERVSELDIGASGPGRVLMPARLGVSPEDAWHCGRSGMKRALWERRVPHEDCWTVADGMTGTVVEWGSTLETALARWREAIERDPPRREPAPESPAPGQESLDPDDDAPWEPEDMPHPWQTGEVHRFRFVLRRGGEPPPIPAAADMPAAILPLRIPSREIPPAYRQAGFRRWQPLLGDQGHCALGLIRDEGRGFTMVGDALLDLVDPAEIDARLDAMLTESGGTPGGGPIMRLQGRPLPWRVLSGNWSSDSLQQLSRSDSPSFCPRSFDGDTHSHRVTRVLCLSEDDDQA